MMTTKHLPASRNKSMTQTAVLLMSPRITPAKKGAETPTYASHRYKKLRQGHTLLGRPFQIPHKRNTANAAVNVTPIPKTAASKADTIETVTGLFDAGTDMPCNNSTSDEEEEAEKTEYNDEETLTEDIENKSTDGKPRPTKDDSTLPNTGKRPANTPTSLPPDLTSLHPLIESQLKVFSNHMKELGNINLTLSKTIENKKNSYHLLLNENKIPHSLCNKYKLTTSPEFNSNAEFLQLKADLQNEVTHFIKNGTRIMTQWANINIKLLTLNRCTALLTKALQVLDGLVSYNGEIIGKPNWPSAGTWQTTLLLFKLYMSNSFVCTDRISEYLKVSKDNIILIGTKILAALENNDAPQGWGGPIRLFYFK